MSGIYLNHYTDFVTTQNKLDNQAVLVGGIRTDLTNIGSNVTAIALQTNQIPTLARGNDLAIVRTETGNIPRATYSGDFAAVNTRLDGIQSTINSMNSGGSGSASSVISLNSTEFLAPLIVNLPWLDITYLLGASDTGYANNIAFSITANSTEGFTPINLTSRADTRWYSTNAASRFLTIDFGFNKTIRKIKLTNLGFQSYLGGGIFNPINLIISGSDNNSTYTTIYTWSEIGFTGDAQWKYASFSNTTSYRYIRITQSGLNSGGNNYFASKGLRFYGSIQNP